MQLQLDYKTVMHITTVLDTMCTLWTRNVDIIIAAMQGYGHVWQVTLQRVIHNTQHEVSDQVIRVCCI